MFNSTELIIIRWYSWAGLNPKFSERCECILFAFEVAAEVVTLTNKKNKPLFGCLLFYLCSFSPCFVPLQKSRLFSKNAAIMEGMWGLILHFRQQLWKKEAGVGEDQWLKLMEVTH